MKALFDTSVLVPTFLGDHEHHEASLDVFLRFEKRQACCAAHSLAEVYATLTRMPGKYRVSCEQAMLFLAEIRQRLTLVALDEEEYYATIEQASALGVMGGTVYDALLARCALKARAETLYTWNVKHFQQLGLEEVVKRIRTP
ncbi:MAG: PIN domain-containing protein [Terriglobia bacterium]